MSSLARLVIHPSQFPDRVRRDLIQSLRARQVNHKFHYDSVKQAQQWLALHQAYSPSRTDADCAAIYDRSFAAATSRISGGRVHLIGLGCGGGQKDTRLLHSLKQLGKRAAYTPSDVSVAMVLVARQAASAVISVSECHPFVCDLLTTEDLPPVLDELIAVDSARLVTFFGMIPNFEPQAILSKLASVVRENDCLLLSANLAPGPDYFQGIQRILPLYDNSLTRDWLLTFLLDLGVEKGDGTLNFTIEACPAGTELKRVAAYFYFNRHTTVPLGEERFDFPAGDSLRMFFSYRHTPDSIRALLGRHGLDVLEQWITVSGEEGVFLARRRYSISC